MLVLAVAASCPDQEPAVFLKLLKDITNLHGETLPLVFGVAKFLTHMLDASVICSNYDNSLGQSPSISRCVDEPSVVLEVSNSPIDLS